MREQGFGNGSFPCSVSLVSGVVRVHPNGCQRAGMDLTFVLDAALLVGAIPMGEFRPVEIGHGSTSLRMATRPVASRGSRPAVNRRAAPAIDVRGR